MAATTSQGRQRRQVLDMFQALRLPSTQPFRQHLTHLALSRQRVLTLHLRDHFQDPTDPFSFLLQAQLEASIGIM